MKYNWSIIGHEKQLSQLESNISSGNIAHAYLLAGPNSVGKHTVAKKMAGILQCENDFCHKCNTCLQIEHGSHIDTVEFRDNKESFKLEAVRKLLERAMMSAQANYKIFIVQSIERMTIEAANSFLKVLEEPPQKTIFILTTNNIRALLPTIVSRVRVLKFTNFSAHFLVDKLNELFPGSDPEVVKQISLFSMGKTGKALSLMENPEVLADYVKTYNDVQTFLSHRSLVDRFSYVEGLLEEEGSVSMFLNILTHVLRSKVLEGDRNSKKHLNSLLKIEETGILLKKNINPRLVLENLMICI